ncbi:MAG TPA: hypothetical protein GX529_05880 [Firmicutes bacterium]|nr:hypothetical protein [Candidatus Fermentithermobacillaceae bacterium]
MARMKWAGLQEVHVGYFALDICRFSIGRIALRLFILQVNWRKTEGADA